MELKWLRWSWTAMRRSCGSAARWARLRRIAIASRTSGNRGSQAFRVRLAPWHCQRSNKWSPKIARWCPRWTSFWSTSPAPWSAVPWNNAQPKESMRKARIETDLSRRRGRRKLSLTLEVQWPPTRAKWKNCALKWRKARSTCRLGTLDSSAFAKEDGRPPSMQLIGTWWRPGSYKVIRCEKGKIAVSSAAQSRRARAARKTSATRGSAEKSGGVRLAIPSAKE